MGQSALFGTLQQKPAVCTQEGNYDTDIPVMTGSCRWLQVWAYIVLSVMNDIFKKL
jgi:hypothetical protein